MTLQAPKRQRRAGDSRSLDQRSTAPAPRWRDVAAEGGELFGRLRTRYQMPELSSLPHGDATVSAYSVVHGRDGAPEWTLLVCDLPGGTRTYAYDANHHLTQTTDERGVIIVANTYDSYGRVINPHSPDETVNSSALAAI